MGDPVQKTEQKNQFEINTQAQNPVQENQIQNNPVQMNQQQVAQNINVNQNAQEQQPGGDIVYKGHVIKQQKSPMEQAEEQASIIQHKGVMELHDDLFDGVYSKIGKEIREDRMREPGGTMESADYIFMQGSEIQNKLRQSDVQNQKNRYDNVAGFDKKSEKSWNKSGMTFEKFIFSTDLQKALKEVNLTDEGSVEIARKQLKKAMDRCEEIMNPIYQQKSDQIFENAQSNVKDYYEKLTAGENALNDVFGTTSKDVKKSEETVLGGDSLLQNKQKSEEYVLNNLDELNSIEAQKAQRKKLADCIKTLNEKKEQKAQADREMDELKEKSKNASQNLRELELKIENTQGEMATLKKSKSTDKKTLAVNLKFYNQKLKVYEEQRKALVKEKDSYPKKIKACAEQQEKLRKAVGDSETAVNKIAYKWEYEWDPAELIKKARQDKNKAVLDKDGNPVNGERTTASGKEMQDFADAIIDGMCQQLVDYLIKKFDLSTNDDDNIQHLMDIKELVKQNGGFAGLRVLKQGFKTNKGVVMRADWDVSEFVESKAVKQMQSLCDYARDYGQRLEEKPFYDLSVDRIDLLAAHLNKGILMMDGTFVNIEQQFSNLLKEHSIPVETKETDPVEKAHVELELAVTNHLDQPKYGMSNSGLYSFYRGYHEIVQSTIICDSTTRQMINGDLIKERKITLDLVPEKIKKLNAAYDTIRGMVDKVIADYARSKGIDHDQDPMDGASATKKYTLRDITEGGAIWDDLKNEPLWALYQGVYDSIEQIVTGINQYKEDIEEYGIKKDSKVGDYYANVKDVRAMLQNCDKNLQNSAMNGNVAKAYQEIQDLKQELTDIRNEDLQKKDEQKSQKKLTEAEMIAKGRKIYLALAKCDALRGNLAERWDFADSIQGRKLFAMVEDIRYGLCNNLQNEKKEELAFFEGSLIREKLSSVQKKMEEEKKQKVNMSVQEQMMLMVTAYHEIKGDISNYLSRYGSIKESCYYVKNIELQRDSYTRLIKEFSSKITVATCEEVSKEMDLDKRLYRGSYDVTTGQRLDELTDKAKNQQLTVKETTEWLDKIFDIQLATGTMMRGGMNAPALMKKLGYTSGPFDLGKLTQFANKADVQHTLAIKHWINKKAGEYSVLYSEMKEKIKLRVGETDRFLNEMHPYSYYADYLISQTKLGSQLRAFIACCDWFFGDNLEEYPEDMQALKRSQDNLLLHEDFAATMGLEKSSQELLERQAIETYGELKKSNNLEAKYQNASKQFKEAKGNSIADALAELKKADKLIDKNSDVFQKVVDEAKKLEELENSPEPDYAAVKAQYDLVITEADAYIKARDNIWHAWSDNGIKRLEAVKGLKAAIASNIPGIGQLLDHSHNDLQSAKQNVEEKNARLKAFRKRMQENPDVSAQEFRVQFEQEFGKDLKNFDDDSVTGIAAGVDYMTELKLEELKLSRLSTKWVLEQSEAIKKECFEKDPSSLSKEEQYRLWAKSYGFYLNNKDRSTEESKATLESLDIISRTFMNEEESKAIKDTIERDKKAAKECAAGTNNDLVTMMHLKWKHEKFLKGVDENIGAFIPGYREFHQNMKVVIEKATKKINGKDGTSCLKSAQKGLNARLQKIRDDLAKSNFADSNSGSEVIGTIREGLTELTFLEETFGFLRKDNSYDMDEQGFEDRMRYNTSILNYYRVQKENLQSILSGYVLRDIVVSDMNLSYQKEAKKKNLQGKANSYGTISNVVLSDERMNKMKVVPALESGDMNSYEEYIGFIVETETEKLQLGDLEKMAGYNPEMAEEVKKQSVIRADFERYLKSQKEMNPEHKKRLQECLQNKAQKYVDKLKQKLKMITDKHLVSDEERLVCYITSLSKYYDEAKMFVRLAGKWAGSNKNVNIESVNFNKLVETLNYIDGQAENARKQKGFEAIARDLKEQADGLKNEDAKMRYSTREVCERNDENFAVSLRNIGELKLDSAENLRVNDKIKAERMRYNVEKYNKMEIKKNRVFKLFGYTLYGHDLFSINDMISRLEQYVYVYDNSFEIEKRRHNLKKGETLECPLQPVLRDLKLIKDLGKRLGEPDKLSDQEMKEIPTQFNNLIYKLNRKFVDACHEAVGFPKEEELREDEKTMKKYFKATDQEYTEEYQKKLKKDEDKLMEGWDQLYGVLKGIPSMIRPYMDRRPSPDKKILNHDLRENHALFLKSMSDLNNTLKLDSNEKQQDDALFEALRQARLGENMYAESALEHNVNMECTLYSQQLAALAESKCYKRCQEALEKLNSMTAEERDEKADGTYKDFIKYITTVYLSAGISGPCFMQLKDRMDEEMKYCSRKTMDVKTLKETQAEVLQEMLKSIRIPEERPGDPQSALYVQVMEQYKEVLENSGMFLIRSLGLLYLQDDTLQLKLDSEEYLKAAELVNSNFLWRYIVLMSRRLKKYLHKKGIV